MQGKRRCESPPRSKNAVSCEVIPFPYARRCDGLAYRIARRAAEFQAQKIEEHVQRQLKIQADTMRRRGIEEWRIQDQICSLETLVRLAQASLPFHTDDVG